MGGEIADAHDHPPAKRAKRSHHQHRVSAMEKRVRQGLCGPRHPLAPTECHVIYWFRRALRLHDNPSLLRAMHGATTVRFIYILDMQQLSESMHKSYMRARFLVECLRDIDSSLQHLGARLHVVQGQPCTVFPQLFRKWPINRLLFEAEPESHGSSRDHIITTRAMSMGVDVAMEHSHTLYDSDVIRRLNKNESLSTFSQFLSAVREIEAPPYPAAALGFEHVGRAKFPLEPNHDELYAIPEIEFPEGNTKSKSRFSNKLPGGELAALVRLERHLLPKFQMSSDNVPVVNVPFGNSALTLSPYLRFGCLSPRLLYWKLSEMYMKIHKSGRPNFSLHGHLLWREFAYTLGATHQNLDQIKGNNLCVPIPWDHNERTIKKWAEGRTGYPFVDAIMTQLRLEGWIHDICRYVAACFLTYGALWQSWEEGSKIFSERLIDADYSTNSIAWLWSSCSSMLRQYPKPHDPIVVGKIMDPEGSYIRRYLPVLSRFPNRYIHKPSAAPIEVQEAAGCIIGKHYPLPMIDHHEAAMVNEERLKQVFKHIFLSIRRAKGLAELSSDVHGDGRREDSSSSGVSNLAAMN